MSSDKRLARRSFLARSLATGAALSLPWIGRPTRARADAAQPLNLMTVFIPDGIVPSLWFPTGTETAFTLPMMSDPLSAVRDDLLMFKGLAMLGGEPSHPGGTKKVLTATGAQSIDVFLGQKLKGSAAFDSIQLGVASNFENGSGTISFLGAGQEVKPDDDPLNVFNRLFGGATSAPTMPTGGMTAPDLGPKQKKSILDVVMGDVSALEKKLGSVEKTRLDTHLQALRDVESRIDGTALPMTGASSSCNPAGFNKQGYRNVDMYYPLTYDKVENFKTIGQLQMDLAVQALGCGLTHVVTMMWSHAVSPTIVPGLGTTLGNHDSSHYGTDPNGANAKQYTLYRRFFMSQIVSLAQAMKAMPYGDSNLLDHTVILLCSDIGDGDLHEQKSCPFALVGGSKAGFKGGRFLDFTGKGMGGDNETHAKLLVSIAQHLGVPIDSFGYTAAGTGPLSGV